MEKEHLADGWLTVKDVARRLGRSKETVRRRIRAGEIKARREGNRFVVRESDLETYMGRLPRVARERTR